MAVVQGTSSDAAIWVYLNSPLGAGAGAADGAGHPARHPGEHLSLLGAPAQLSSGLLGLCRANYQYFTSRQMSPCRFQSTPPDSGKLALDSQGLDGTIYVDVALARGPEREQSHVVHRDASRSNLAGRRALDDSPASKPPAELEPGSPLGIL